MYGHSFFVAAPFNYTGLHEPRKNGRSDLRQIIPRLRFLSLHRVLSSSSSSSNIFYTRLYLSNSLCLSSLLPIFPISLSLLLSTGFTSAIAILYLSLPSLRDSLLSSFRFILRTAMTIFLSYLFIRPVSSILLQRARVTSFVTHTYTPGYTFGIPRERFFSFQLTWKSTLGLLGQITSAVLNRLDAKI